MRYILSKTMLMHYGLICDIFVLTSSLRHIFFYFNFPPKPLLSSLTLSSVMRVWSGQNPQIAYLAWLIIFRVGQFLQQSHNFECIVHSHWSIVCIKINEKEIKPLFCLGSRNDYNWKSKHNGLCCKVGTISKDNEQFCDV